MLQNLYYSVAAVVPLFIMILLGYGLRRAEFASEVFFSTASKIVFYVALPASLFRSVIATDLAELWDLRFVIFIVVISVSALALIWLGGIITIKDKALRGAFVQGAFRSNIAILGIPLMMNIAGEAGIARAALIIIAVLPFYNIGSVLVLAVNNTSDKRIGFKDIIFTILKNPLIIGITSGILLLLFDFSVPPLIESPINHLANMATPLALIALGGGIRFAGFDKRFVYAFAASAVKVIIKPTVFVTVGYLFGFRGTDLAGLLMLGGTPSAIAGYITVTQMGGDKYTAGTIVLISTAMSAFTLTIFVYLLRSLGLMIL